MVGSAYAVWWEGAQGVRCAGRLDLDGRSLILTGAVNGCRAQEKIPFQEIDDIRLEAGRVHVTRRDGRSLSIGSLDAPGALRELADRLATSVAARTRS